MFVRNRKEPESWGVGGGNWRMKVDENELKEFPNITFGTFALKSRPNVCHKRKWMIFCAGMESRQPF